MAGLTLSVAMLRPLVDAGPTGFDREAVAQEAADLDERARALRAWAAGLVSPVTARSVGPEARPRPASVASTITPRR